MVPTEGSCSRIGIAPLESALCGRETRFSTDISSREHDHRCYKDSTPASVAKSRGAMPLSGPWASPLASIEIVLPPPPHETVTLTSSQHAPVLFTTARAVLALASLDGLRANKKLTQLPAFLLIP